MVAPPDSASRQLRVGLAFICVLTLLALLPVVRGGWILDDELLLQTNRRIHALSSENVRFLLSHDMWDLDVAQAQIAPRLVYYRPLLMLSYAVDWALGSGSSTHFHVTNMLLHAAVTCLVGRAVLRWTRSAPGALFAAAYFGLHPARAESAAWISGRPDVLAAFGLLLALEGVSAARSAAKLGGAALFALGCVIAFASKETSVLLPVLVAVELGTGDAAHAPGSRWQRHWTLLVALALPIIYLGARRAFLPMRPFPIVGLDFVTHAGFVLETLGRASMYFLVPFDLSMNGSTITERHGKVAPHPQYLAVGAAIALVLVVSLVWTRRRHPRVFWALVAFVLSLLPTLNLVWIGGTGVTSPRFFYLPSVLFSWVLVELGRGRFRALTDQRAAWASCAFALGLTPLLALQASVYRDSDLFWAGEVRNRPDEPFGLTIFARRDWERGDLERAIARGLCQYRLALERFSYMGKGATTLLEALERWSQALPDAESEQLRGIADFTIAAREPTGPAVLHGVFEIDVPPGSKVRRELVRSKVRLLTLEAEIRVRLGERDRALALLREARAACERCDDLRDRQALTAYRAFDLGLAKELAREELAGRPTAEALELLRRSNAAIDQARGVQRTQLEVQRLSELQLPGEALRLVQRQRVGDAEAAGALEEIEMHLAARSGDQQLSEKLARRLHLPPPKVAPSASAERVLHYSKSFEQGCAFPEELE